LHLAVTYECDRKQHYTHLYSTCGSDDSGDSHPVVSESGGNSRKKTWPWGLPKRWNKK
jgi:hypothetical protein